MNIENVSTMLAIALNTKPENRQRTKETRAETMEILAKMANEIQSELLEYECLKEVVKKHRDCEDIITEAKLKFNERVG